MWRRAIFGIVTALLMAATLAMPASASPAGEAGTDGEAGTAACLQFWWWEPTMGDVTVINNCSTAYRLKAKYGALVWGGCHTVWGYGRRVWEGTWAPVTEMASC